LHADRHAARGQHAAHPRPASGRGHGPEPAHLPQVRGLQPHGLVQGSRHDHGHLQGRGGGLARRHLRLDGQHVRLRRRPCGQLGRAPDYHLIPVGNAGNISAYWRGYREYHRAGIAKELPKMVGFQAAGAAPIVEDRVIAEPKTLATAIRIGNPASWGLAKEALSDSSGWIDSVTDEEIVRGYRMLAREEGIFMEPASCATV